MSAELVSGIVAMRDSGSTWQAVGRAFGVQDGFAKRLYDGAKIAA